MWSSSRRFKRMKHVCLQHSSCRHGCSLALLPCARRPGCHDSGEFPYDLYLHALCCEVHPRDLSPGVLSVSGFTAGGATFPPSRSFRSEVRNLWHSTRLRCRLQQLKHGNRISTHECIREWDGEYWSSFPVRHIIVKPQKPTMDSPIIFLWPHRKRSRKDQL